MKSESLAVRLREKDASRNDFYEFPVGDVAMVVSVSGDEWHHRRGPIVGFDLEGGPVLQIDGTDHAVYRTDILKALA